MKKKAKEPWYVDLFGKKRKKPAQPGVKSKGKPTPTAGKKAAPAASPPEEEPAEPQSEPKAAAQPQTKAKQASAESEDAAFLDFLDGGPE